METKLIRSEQAAEGTMSFHFERPAEFNFKGGQSIDLTLVNPPETDDEGNTRAFSIAAAPYENEIMITTRMRDTAFKRVLKTLAPGAPFKFEGPFGSMTLHNDTAKPAVILAGGIGITPFRSMVLQAAHDKLPHKIFLFYSNRRPEDAAFLKELTDLEKENPNYKFIGTMTNMTDSKMLWSGETGYIDGTMIKKYVTDLAAPIYYMAGPPAMAAAMRKMLNENGINDDYIRAEEFSGY